MLQRPGLAFFGVVGIGFMVDCVALKDDTLRWGFCGRSTGKWFYLLRLTGANDG